MALDLDAMPPTVQFGAPVGAPTSGTGLLWRRGPHSRPVTGPRARCDQQEFARRLAAAGVLDLRVVELPGSVITLPYGMRLMRRFESIVRRRYEALGFEEYDYPLLVHPDAMKPTGDLLDLRGRLLHAGDDTDWESGHRRAVLTPTGEAIVYTHWAKLVRGEHDLPIKMYRK